MVDTEVLRRVAKNVRAAYNNNDCVEAQYIDLSANEIDGLREDLLQSNLRERNLYERVQLLKTNPDEIKMFALDELKAMSGQPVWVKVGYNYPICAIVKVNENCADGGWAIDVDGNRHSFLKYHKGAIEGGWVAFNKQYSAKPKED
jgi:hypothetical protein